MKITNANEQLELFKTEIWLPIKGYEGLCEISNQGRVKSLAIIVGKGFKSEKVRQFKKNVKNYQMVGLTKDGKQNLVYVHRLVLMAFKPMLDYKNMEVNHINGIKTDNNLNNLEWMTHLENMRHAIEAGLKNPKNKGYSQKSNKERFLRRVPIIQLTLKGEFIKNWEGSSFAAKFLNLSVGNLCNCCNGKLKTCGGFKWQYAKKSA